MVLKSEVWKLPSHVHKHQYDSAFRVVEVAVHC
jgi:hypothetical protein